MNLIKNKGFTIIEAIVSLALFAIAFSGLYFFFGMAHQAYNNSEKRMHLNLMANHILDTIHAEAFRADADVANPFVTPVSYTANLSDCSIYTAPDVRHTWCTELDASVGPHKGVHADEIRTVEVVKDETYLIANVSLVVDAGIGEKNLIKTFLSRKIAAPRRSTPQQICIESHENRIATVKNLKAQCDAGTIPSLQAKWWSNFSGGGYGTMERVWNVSCPDYINLPGSAARDPNIAYTVGESLVHGSNLHRFWGLYFQGKQQYLDDTGRAQTNSTNPYPDPSETFPATFKAGSFMPVSKYYLKRSHGWKYDQFCTAGSDYSQLSLAGNEVDCNSTEVEGTETLHFQSCCPSDENLTSKSGYAAYGYGKCNIKKSDAPWESQLKFNIIKWP